MRRQRSSVFRFKSSVCERLADCISRTYKKRYNARCVRSSGVICNFIAAGAHIKFIYIAMVIGFFFLARKYPRGESIRGCIRTEMVSLSVVKAIANTFRFDSASKKRTTRSVRPYNLSSIVGLFPDRHRNDAVFTSLRLVGLRTADFVVFLIPPRFLSFSFSLSSLRSINLLLRRFPIYLYDRELHRRSRIEKCNMQFQQYIFASIRWEILTEAIVSRIMRWKLSTARTNFFFFASYVGASGWKFFNRTKCHKCEMPKMSRRIIQMVNVHTRKSTSRKLHGVDF